jgi:processive 1,2-diacylglycerol beta-glucosyltransferase
LSACFKWKIEPAKGFDTMQPRLLFMHATPRSGHQRASRAIERAVSQLSPSVAISSVDAFEYSSSIVRWAIYRIYYSLIKHQPDVWEYLYDNPAVQRKVEALRALLHRYQRRKFERFIAAVQPDAIICTQAYPCGMAADFKQRSGAKIPIIGVLTDYAPHLYWFHPDVDCYVVPSEQVKARFIERGVNAARIRVCGIPVDERFVKTYDRESLCRELGLNSAIPVLLIMGGSGGFGQIRDVVQQLDRLPNSCQMLVLAGTNTRLLHWIRSRSFRHSVRALPYTNEVYKLMSVATLLISKPGGMTTAESMAQGLPMVIVNPIPGQEDYNARYLIAERAAVQAIAPSQVRQTVRDLLENPERLADLRNRVQSLARPSAAQDIARLIFQLIGTHPAAVRGLESTLSVH